MSNVETYWGPPARRGNIFGRRTHRLERGNVSTSHSVGTECFHVGRACEAATGKHSQGWAEYVPTSAPPRPPWPCCYVEPVARASATWKHFWRMFPRRCRVSMSKVETYWGPPARRGNIFERRTQCLELENVSTSPRIGTECFHVGRACAAATGKHSQGCAENVSPSPPPPPPWNAHHTHEDSHASERRGNILGDWRRPEMFPRHRRGAIRPTGKHSPEMFPRRGFREEAPAAGTGKHFGGRNHAKVGHRSDGETFTF
eukprot:gene13103-biopygen4378